MKKIISFTLALVMVFALSANAFALTTGDLNGNGNITAYDAQIVNEALHGARKLTDEQVRVAIATNPSETTLGVSHVLAILSSILKNEFSPIGGYYQIWTVRGMMNMKNILTDPTHPNYATAKFKLMADVDMGGASWEGGILNGSFDGNDHTISNLSVTADSDAILGGLFDQIAEGATVKDLTLKNVSVTTDSSVSKNVGCLCGQNSGTILDCSVQNALISGKTKAGGTVGFVVGKNVGTMDVCGDCFGTISDTHSYCNGAYGMSPGTARLSTNGSSDSTEEEMRQTVVNYMKLMGTTKWTTGRDICYACSCANYDSPEHPGFCKHNYYANTTYYGLPYTHNSGSVERAAFCFDNVTINPDGTYVLSGLKDFASVLLDRNNPNLIDFSCYLGNDCSGAVYNAWARVSDSITFRWTQNMVPTDSNESEYGICKVGDYQFVPNTIAKVPKYATCVYDTVNKQWLYNCATLDPENEQKIIDAWLNCKAGDGMVTLKYDYDGTSYTCPGGHARLICEDVVPVYDDQGKLDLDNTMVYTYEQGASNTSNTGKLSTWALHGITDDPTNTERYKKNYACGFSLNELMGYKRQRSGDWVYVPITCSELLNASQDETASVVMLRSPVDGRLGSNYRILSTTVSVAGQTSTIFTGLAGFRQPKLDYEGIDSFSATFTVPGGSTTDQLSRTTIRSVDLAEHSANIDLSKLASGQSYPYTVSMFLANGETVEYSGSYTKP